MTKIEKDIINKFVLKICKSDRRKFVAAKIFDKKESLGRLTAVVRVKDILKEWNKVVRKLEKKNGK